MELLQLFWPGRRNDDGHGQKIALATVPNGNGLLIKARRMTFKYLKHQRPELCDVATQYFYRVVTGKLDLGRFFAPGSPGSCN